MRDAIVLAIPVFFILMAVEWAAYRRRPPAENDYFLDDTLSNLGCGAGQQVAGALLAAVMLGGYEAVRASAGLFTLPADSPWVWLGALLGVDFLYYWFHRASHRVNLLWAAHVVHHQSEHYNLAVALRQSWLQQFFSFFFYLPLALIGVPTVVFFTAVALDTLYQFWIHTRLIDRMGPLEAILNTPSHHRVHHGVDGPYLDRNHAGLLITWDRLFGTFEPESSAPRYGTVKPLRSANPVWANVAPWVELWQRARGMERFSDRLRVFFAPPEWRASGEAPPPGPLRTDADYALFRVPAGGGRRLYVTGQFLAVLGGVLWLLSGGAADSPALRTAFAGLLLASFGVLGGVLESRPWARVAEPLRLAVAAGLIIAAVLAAQGASSSPPKL
jgi:sterol desaturase/sphingolipid hydroxylase (fatty acid hydroxylase superfamily)